MAKQLLVETRMNCLSLCESKKQTHPGCLGTLSGPCADFVNPTRNNNMYGRKLWENVFSDPLVKESLEDRVLIGELDHPGDRLETKATNACIVMTDYEFDDNNGTINGVFDILDTPNGRILRSLLDYGCRVGVSSRGEGDVVTKEGVDYVDEDSYYFVAFDAVVLPAVKKAKPALKESLKRETLKESLKSQVEEAKTKPELDLIKKVVEATNLPDVDSLLESIDNKSKELEGTNCSSNLMEDLEESTRQIQSLTEENSNLKKEVANCKSRIERFVKSRCKMIESESSQNQKLEALNEDYKDVVFKFTAESKKVESLTSKLDNSRGAVRKLREELMSANSLRDNLEEKVGRLEESLERSQSANREKSKTISSLREELETTKSSFSQKLSESKTREVNARKEVQRGKATLNESQQREHSMMKEYAERRAEVLGVDSKRIVESLKSGMKFSDVDNLINEEVDRADRYRKVPKSNDILLSSLSKSTVSVSTDKKISQEDSDTLDFMKQYYKL